MWNPFKKITYDSPINGVITVGTQKGEKAIFAGGVTQSGGELVQMWDTVIGNLHKENIPVKNFLLLGVGAGMIFRVIKQYYPKATMTGVDIDPVMKDVAIKEFNWIDTKKQKIITADVLNWILKAPKNTFDLIVVDLFIGALNAPKTREERFLKYLKMIQTKEGIILYNTHYQKPEEYSKFLKQTKRIFTNVSEVFSYPLNRVLRLE